MKLFRLIIPPVAMILLTAGCSRRIMVPVENVSVRTDTVRIISATSDTVIWRDSVVVAIRGDTVVKEAWRLRDRVAHTSADRNQVSRDTIVRQIPVEVERRVEVEVERPLTLWQRIRLSLGSLMLIATFISLLLLISKIRKR